MPRLKDRNFWESRTLNNYGFMQYYNRLVELSVSMFNWEGLPDTIDKRYLELCLFGDGKAVFFQDETIGHLALRCASGGPLNVYGIPVTRTAYAANGYNRTRDETNSVLIWNNMIHTNSVLDVEQFARRLYELDRTVDVNTRAQKTPVLILCDEGERLTVKQVYKKYDGNEPVIYGTSGLQNVKFTVLKTDAPYISDKIYQLKTQYWNEALTYLGISNVNIVKKERQIVDEVLRNQGGTIASRYSRLNARQNAADEINRMFGLNIKVSYNEDIQTLEQDSTDTQDVHRKDGKEAYGGKDDG